MLKDPLTAWGHECGQCYGGRFVDLRFETGKLIIIAGKNRKPAEGQTHPVLYTFDLRLPRIYSQERTVYSTTNTEAGIIADAF